MDWTSRLPSTDFLLVHSYASRIPAEVLALAPRGAVNIHGALLPQYRGANPIQWAILNDERRTGATMHYMTESIDAGPIIAQRVVPIEFDDTWVDVQARIDTVVSAMLTEMLPRLWRGDISPTPQDESLAHYHRRRHPEDGRINWDDSVRHIYNLIRALVAPHPGAWSDEPPEKRCVISRYLTLSEVAALKFGTSGRRRLTDGTVDLLPMPFVANTGERERDAVVCEVRRRDTATAVARAVVRGVSMPETASIEVSATESGHENALQRARPLLLKLAQQECGLRDVAVYG
jgi:hypothetical protein